MLNKRNGQIPALHIIEILSNNFMKCILMILNTTEKHAFWTLVACFPSLSSLSILKIILRNSDFRAIYINAQSFFKLNVQHIPGSMLIYLFCYWLKW